MRIGVIGAGSMGGILARHLAKLGHHVSIANSRGPESLTALAAEIGATPVSVVDAAKAGEIVILAIPTKAVADLPRGLFANVPSSVVVIDIGNYHPELRDGRIDAIDRGMLDSQWVAQQIGRPVIKAFNNIFAKSLLEKGVPRGTKGRIALSVAGDSSDAKAAVLRLVDDLGFDPVDGGDLDNSWRQQPGTPAYCRDLEAAALRRALAEADRSRIAEYRAEQEARIRRSYRSADTRRFSASMTDRIHRAVLLMAAADSLFGRTCRPLPARAMLQVAVPPIRKRAHCRVEGSSELGGRVLDSRWHFVKCEAADESVCFHLAQLLNQHLLADIRQEALQLTEATCLVAQLPENHRFPLAADDLESRPDAAGVWSLRHRVAPTLTN